MKAISTIEGIGPAYAAKLKGAGVGTVEDLLEAGGTKSGRGKLAAAAGISESMVLKWVNMADLFRVKGVAGQYAELLECAGVDTVRELAQRNAASLRETMAQANAKKQVVRVVPGLSRVQSWVSQAKALPRRVSY